MKNQMLSLVLGSFMGLAAVAAPVAAQVPQDQPAAPATQQPQHERHQVDPNRQVQMLTKKLNLTADQQNQILPILTDRQQQIANIMSDNSLSRKDRHAKMTSIREDSKNKIEAVLSADQKQTYEQMLQKRHQHERENKS